VKNINILIIGYGSIGIRHHRVLKRIYPNANIRVLKRKTPENLDDTTLCFDNTKDALRFQPEILAITNPASMHVDTGLNFIDKCKVVLIEKPLSINAKESKRLINKYGGKCNKVMIGYNLRFEKSLNYYRKLINEGAIGQPLFFECRVGQFLPTWRNNIDYRDSVSGKNSLGGGVCLELSHELDYVSWVLGKIKWVMADIKKQSQLEIDVEDTAMVIAGLSFKNNQNEIRGTISLDFIRQETVREFVVVGENGTLRWDGVRRAVDIYENNSWDNLYINNEEVDATYIYEWMALINAVEGNKPSPISLAEGYEVMRVVDSIKESSASGKKIFI
jgi:predicted dehydrogenase